jgi:hypothetical protein
MINYIGAVKLKAVLLNKVKSMPQTSKSHRNTLIFHPSKLKASLVKAVSIY